MAALIAFAGASNTLADELGPWQIGRTTGADGAAMFAASLFSSTLLDTGIEGEAYAPTLSFGCRLSGEPRWSQWLKLNDPVSDDEDIDIEVSIDGREPVEQVWNVGPRNRVLIREGAADIAALKRAKTVTLSWNWGWSWLWLSDEATFELVEFPSVLYTLAKSCNVPEP